MCVCIYMVVLSCALRVVNSLLHVRERCPLCTHGAAPIGRFGGLVLTHWFWATGGASRGEGETSSGHLEIRLGSFDLVPCRLALDIVQGWVACKSPALGPNWPDDPQNRNTWRARRGNCARNARRNGGRGAIGEDAGGPGHGRASSPFFGLPVLRTGRAARPVVGDAPRKAGGPGA